MPAPVEKLSIADAEVLATKNTVRDFLLLNGWVQGEATENVAAACAHLARIYGSGLHVSIAIEQTPAHYQVTVNQL